MTFQELVESEWAELHDTDAVIKAVMRRLVLKSNRALLQDAAELGIRTECNGLVHVRKTALHNAPRESFSDDLEEKPKRPPKANPTSKGPEVISKVLARIAYSYLEDYRITLPKRGAIALGNCTPEEIEKHADNLRHQGEGCFRESSFLLAVASAGKRGTPIRETLTDSKIAGLFESVGGTRKTG